MKLYTEEQVRLLLDLAKLKINGECYSKETLLENVAPIELPSDEEIKEAVENKFGLVDPILGKSDYRMGYESGLIKGVKWMKDLTKTNNL